MAGQIFNYCLPLFRGELFLELTCLPILLLTPLVKSGVFHALKDPSDLLCEYTN
jgi:hypothetical protein